MIRFALLLAMILAATKLTAAQPAPWPEAPRMLRLIPIEELRQNTTEPRLGNGMVVDPLDWPAVFSGTFLIGGDTFSCTSTLIGPRSLLTAAHCIAEGGTVELTRDGKVYFGRCERAHPGYPDPLSADWALCLMAEDVPAYRYESVSTRTDMLRHDGKLLLAGYGCQFVNGASDGKFRTGPAFIQQSVGEVEHHPYWLATYPGVARGDAFICPGDSGGPVFQTRPGLERAVIAVNSHYDVAGRGVSYLSVLGTAAGSAFLREWAGRFNQRLCGMHADAANCRE